MKIHLYFVYILTNKNHTVLYTGVTSDLIKRCFEHERKLLHGFTARYNVSKLVYYQKFDFIDLAIHREKQIKGYSRSKKKALIDKFNPSWSSLLAGVKILIPIKSKSDE